MPAALEIDLSGDGPHSIETASRSFEAEGAFDVVLRNHGAGLHVHLNLDAGLAAAATLSTANHFVDEGAVRRIRVDVDESHLPAEGRLKVVTGYGSETAHVAVRVVEPGEGADRVDVDERLASPRPRERDTALDPDDLPVLALVAVALVVALLAVALVDDLVILLSVLVALLGVGAAAVLLAR